MESLELSRQDYEELFINASDAIWIQDMMGNITLVNKASEKLTGYPTSELMGKNVNDFLTPEALVLAKEVKARLLSGEVMDERYEQQIIRKDGSEAIVQLATRLIVADGKPQAFQHMARDVTQEKRLREYLQFYLRICLRAQEEERQRLACELHDDTLQMILLLSRHIDDLASKASDYLPQELRDELENLYDLSQQTHQGLKRYAQALRPRILDDLGLLSALKWLAQELIDLTDIKVQVEADAIPPLPSEIQLVLFRIAQEAMRNIQRHSGASEASITLEYQEDENKLRMTITDNGKGFELPEQISDLARQGKLGITGMMERIQLVSGKLEVTSQIGKGTKIIVETLIKLYPEDD
jgi:PAS domain S-box-containing protein